MNKYSKERAEYLQMRSWDLIERLDRTESELNSAKDPEQRRLLKQKIGRLKESINEYAEDYEEAAKEAGIDITLESGRIDRDLIGQIERKTFATGEDLKRKLEIGEIGRFFNVPDRNPKFTGREADVAFFAEQLAKGGALAITGAKGMGGIGKTAIANEVCHLIRQTWTDSEQLPDRIREIFGDQKWFADGVLWMAFERDQRNLNDLTRNILFAITDRVTAEKIKDLETLADILAQKDVLVVLDSVEQNLRSFHYVFEIFKGKAPLLITSRIAIPGIFARDIDQLVPDEAFDLFVKYLRNPDVDECQAESVRHLCQALGHFPLAIRIVAAKADEQNSNLDALKTEYEKARLALLDAGGLDLGLDERNVSIKTCFNMTYNILPSRAQTLFRYAAVFQNPFSADELATVAQVDENEESVDALLDASLIQVAKQEKTDETRYELHPLMREFALDLLAERLPPTDDARMAPNLKLDRELLEFVEKAKKDETLKESVASDDALLPKITRAMQDCDLRHDFETVIRFMDGVRDVIDTLGRWKEKMALNRLAIRASVALQNKAKEAWYRTELADALGRTGRPDDLDTAGIEFEKALVIQQRLQNIPQILYIQYRLSSIDYRHDRYPACMRKNFEGIRDACRYRRYYDAGIFARTIGWIYGNFHIAGGPVASLMNFRQTKWGQDWEKRNFLIAFKDIIDHWYAKGYVDACAGFYAKSLALAGEIRAHDLMASNLIDLFDCYSSLRKADECENLLKAFCELAKAMGIAEGKVYYNQGRFAFLRRDDETALALFDKASEAGVLDEESLRFWIGKIKLRQGDIQKAEVLFNSVLKNKTEEKNAESVATVFTQMAALELKRDNPEKAVEYLSQSVKTKQKLGIVFFKEEEELRQQILERIEEKGLDKDMVEQIESCAHPIDLKPDFLLDELPNSMVGGNGDKDMALIPEGPSFVGKGKVFRLSAEEVLNNIDEYIRKATPEERAKADEATEVYLCPFYMDTSAVTNSEYNRFCDETRHPCPEHWNNAIPENTGHLPVVNITLEDAQAYAQWAGKKIPTEAEWEKACRGENGNIYPWGDEWDADQVKAKTGDIRQTYERRFEELNKDAKGIVVIREERLFEMPSHPNTEFDEEEFLNLLEHSISLTKAEKQNVIDSIPRLKIEQINELISIFTEEKEKFSELEIEFMDDVTKLKKEKFDEFNMPEMFNDGIEILNRKETNISPYGIQNMVGDIYEMTDTQERGRYAIKGGSWFSADPETECRAYHRETIGLREKRMDVGFRCVKPIFSKADLQAAPRDPK